MAELLHCQIIFAASEKELAREFTRGSKKLVTVADQNLELLGRLRTVEKKLYRHAVEASCGQGAHVLQKRSGIYFYLLHCQVFEYVSQAEPCSNL